jgi:hypothetical protein
MAAGGELAEFVTRFGSSSGARNRRKAMNAGLLLFSPKAWKAPNFSLESKLRQIRSTSFHGESTIELGELIARE